MNQQLFETGYAAYQSGDWAAAASAFAQAKDAGEQMGKLDHLRGNALMKLGRYEEAAEAYGQALNDPTYGMSGALNTNRGRALIAAGKVDEAIVSLRAATQDPTYATPYKAYMALGGACRSIGDIRGAGIAYRNAAIDEKNPNPTSSLRKLGGCFMDLGRPADAVESYRTALDFSPSRDEQNMVYCDLALAYVAANRMTEAVDAFDHATADGTYKLSPEAQAAYDAARNAVAARSGERKTSDTDDMLAAAGYGGYTVDPLDPTGETSGNLMPSPEDTGFFSVSEDQIVADSRKERRGKGGKVVLVIVVLLVILGAGAGFAYFNGFGWPTQESVVKDVFNAKNNHDDIGRYIAASDAEKAEISSMIPMSSNVNITGVKRGMQESEVMATASLSEGGEVSYSVKLVRDGIGWKVKSFDPVSVSTNGGDNANKQNTNTNQNTQQPAQQSAQQSAKPAEQNAQPAEQQPAQEPMAVEEQSNDSATSTGSVATE